MNIQSEEPPSGDSPIPTPRIRASLHNLLDKGVQTLDRAEQIALSLYYCDGLTLREIGTVMDLEYVDVLRIRFQALQKLRAQLGQALLTNSRAISR